MRKINAGDLEAKLVRIERCAKRGRRWKKKAKAHLLADQTQRYKFRRDGSPESRILYDSRGEFCSKQRYPTLERATIYLEITQSEAPFDPRRREARAYACPRCHGYHLTSTEEPSHDEEIGNESIDQAQPEPGLAPA